MSEPVNIFGTDGVRDVAGQGFLSDDALSRLAMALLQQHGTGSAGGDSGPRVLIGRDPRTSGPAIEARLAGELIAGGGSVTSVGVIPTPAVSLLGDLAPGVSAPFDFGIVISASHNPPEYNGVKVLDARGRKLSVDTELSISAHFHDANPAGSTPTELHTDEELARQYPVGLVRDLGEGSLAGLRIGLDCAFGATAPWAPEVFRAVGAEVFSVNDEPDGDRINQDCGSLHPEGLQRLVRREGCDLGVAFDGDGDRAILVDDGGSVVDGDDCIALWACALSRVNALPGDRVVTTVMSNAGMESYLREQGIEMVRTGVGDREVSERMQAEGIVLGGEQSGHVIFAPEARTGDGIRTGLHLARIVKESGVSLAELRQQIPRFPQVLLGIKVASKPALETLSAVMDAERKGNEQLEGRGRILLRYSGTEPLARVLVEGPDPDENAAIAESIAEAIRQAIG